MNTDTGYAQENIAYWTNRAPGYSEVNKEELAGEQRRVWGLVLAENILKHCPGRKPEDIKVLDVGTGPGFFAIILAEMGFSVTAVDYTARMLAEARHNAGFLARKIQLRGRHLTRLSRGISPGISQTRRPRTGSGPGF